MRPSKPSPRSASAAFAPARPAPDDHVRLRHGSLRQRQELAARARVVAHEPAQRRGDRRRARLLHAAERHAHVLGLEHDADALGRELALQPVGDLRRQPLLDLQRAGEVVDDAGELRQPDDPLAGEVADVRDAARTAAGGARTASGTGCRARRRARRSRRRWGTWWRGSPRASAARRTWRPSGAACPAAPRRRGRRRARSGGRPRRARPARGGRREVVGKGKGMGHAALAARPPAILTRAR